MTGPQEDGGAPPRVGWLGLGSMGGLVVERLLDAGRDVTGWNRTPSRGEPLIAKGMAWADSPREVAERSDVVLSMLTDGAAVEQVTSGQDGLIAGLRPGMVYADMSTIPPEVSRRVAERVAESGATMLDTPVSGSPVTLAQGKLSIMVGGDEHALERIRPVLLDIGPKVTHIGGNGLAVQTKISINLALVVQVIAFCEGVALAEQGGVEREVVVDAMLNSVISSPVLQYRGPFILEGNMPEEALADVDLQQKDMLLALAEGRLLGSPLPLTAAANEMLNGSRGIGIGHKDFVAVHEVYRRLAGAEAQA
jgi:3-hydroxyisobutyrate dehydrogenase-like beta-hydroxyacid dehydrogenase